MTTPPSPTPWPEGTYSDDLMALLNEDDQDQGPGGFGLADQLRRCASEAMRLSASLWEVSFDTVDTEPLQFGVAYGMYFLRLEPDLSEAAKCASEVLVAVRRLAESPPDGQARAAVLAEQAEALLGICDVARRVEALRAKETADDSFVPMVITDPTFHLGGQMLRWILAQPNEVYRSRVRDTLRTLLVNDEKQWNPKDRGAKPDADAEIMLTWAEEVAADCRCLTDDRLDEDPETAIALETALIAAHQAATSLVPEDSHSNAPFRGCEVAIAVPRERPSMPVEGSRAHLIDVS